MSTDAEQQPLFHAAPDDADTLLRERRVLTITGARDLPREIARRWFDERLSSWVGHGHVWLLGGARGADTWAAEWLIERQEECWAVVPFAALDQPTEALSILQSISRLIELNLPKRKASYIKRNHYMVDRSQVVIGFWKGTKGGTLATLEYALRKGREVHAYCVPD